MLPESGTRLTPAFEPIEHVREVVTRELASEMDLHQVEVSVDRRGLILSIPEAGLFPVGSDEVSTTAQALMARVASAMSQLGNQIRVEGHTDSVGNDASNLTLSTNRANAVASNLIKEGVDPSRLDPVGFGATHPIASNSNAAGRQENRRTEFNIVEQ